MMPILFDADARDFTSRGLGPLSDAVSCKVIEERNSTYELVMQYPKDGIHFEDIGLNKIILAIPSPYREAQPFRIYKISTPMRGVVTVNAQHISYDLSGVAVMPFTGNSVADVLNKIKLNSVNQNDFEFTGNSDFSAECVYSTPYTARQILGGIEGSVIDRFGGEYEFDKFTVKWNLNRGANNGVTVRYGKNLLTLNQDVDVSKIVTGVIPYWVDSEGGSTVVGDRVNIDGEYSFEKVIPLDLSQEFEEQPTKEQLNSRAKTYINANYSLEPEINCTVSFALIEQYEEYKDFKLLEQCDLCDIVTVQYPDLGVNSTAKIVKIETDVLKERYNSVTIGSVRANIAQTIVAQQKAVENVPSRFDVSNLLRNSLDKITGAQGGTVRFLDTNGDGEPDTLYIADNPNQAEAQKVWRFNYLGWAASSNGYNGPFTLGATLEDGLLADFVTAANLTAGTIKSADNGETFFLDLLNGVLRMKASSFSIEGKSVDDIAGEAADSALSDAKKYTDTEIEATNKEIELRATKDELDALGNRVTTAESTITTQAGQIALKVTADDVNSLIEQKADSIRLKADKISWESTYSSMSKDGKLKCTGAEINGRFQSNATGDGGAKQGIYVGKDGIPLFAYQIYAGTSEADWMGFNGRALLFGESTITGTIEDYLKDTDFIQLANSALLNINMYNDIGTIKSSRLNLDAETLISLNAPRIVVSNGISGTPYNGYTGKVSIYGGDLDFLNGICVGYTSYHG